MTRVGLILVWLAVFLGLSSLPARALPFDAGHARVELIAEHTGVVPGETYRLALELNIDPHWHVYWKNAGDSGLAAEIIWQETSGVTFGAFQWPLPNPQPLETLMNYGYEDRLVVPFDVTIPANASDIILLQGEAQYLICADICIPEDAPVQLQLSVVDAPMKGLSVAAFEWADARQPKPLLGTAQIDRSASPDWTLSIADQTVRNVVDDDVKKARFYPDDHQILHPPEQPLSYGDNGVSLSLKEAEGLGSDGDLTGVLVFDLEDGSRTGFTIKASPGPVLPETRRVALSPAANLADAGAAQVAPSLFIVFGLMLLGGMILNLMPCVLPVLFIKARSFLTMSETGNTSHLRRHGMFYLLGVVTCFMGLALALLGLRAAGEQAGIGFQLQMPWIVAALSILMFVLALNMLGMFDVGSSIMGVGSGLADQSGLAGAFFTGLLAAFVGAPCIGPFLGVATGVVVSQPAWVVLLAFFALGLGMALPFAALSFFPAVFRVLPKPGPWMERLKQFFAFPLFLTAIWLIWVFGTLTDLNMLALLAISMVFVAFGIWLLTSAPQEGKGRLIAKVIGGIILVGAIATPVVSSMQDEEAISYDYEGDWSTERVAELQAEGRAVFIDFTASWCITCQLNKRTTLFTREVQTVFNDYDVAFLVADWTKRDDVIGAELARHGRAGVPLYLYYPEGKNDPVVLPQLLTPDTVVSAVTSESGN